MMDPNNNNNMSREAPLIFTTIHEFICGTDKHKRSDELESFPHDFQRIPWRQVYKPPAAAEAQSAAGATLPIMEHWQPSELPFGGAGPLWLFTVLPRIGENVSRKTEDGQTWSSKSGRGHKKGYPIRIWVDKLVISSKTFHMLELTLNQEKPSVALCKIWRKGNISAVSSLHTTNLTASASTTEEVENSPINEGKTTAMQMDQPQVIQRQQQMHDSPLLMSGYVLVDSTQALPVPDFTGGCIQWQEQDEDSIYQGAVSYLYEEKDSFKHVASCSKDMAQEMASAAQSLATTLRNVLNFLGMKKEPESSRSKRARTDNQIIGEANNVANTTAEPAPEATTPKDHGDKLAQQTEGYSINSLTIDQELAQLMDGYSMGNDTDQELTQPIEGQFIDDFFNLDEFINRDGGTGQEQQF